MFWFALYRDNDVFRVLFLDEPSLAASFAIAPAFCLAVVSWNPQPSSPATRSCRWCSGSTSPCSFRPRACSSWQHSWHSGSQLFVTLFLFPLQHPPLPLARRDAFLSTIGRCC